MKNAVMPSATTADSTDLREYDPVPHKGPGESRTQATGNAQRSRASWAATEGRISPLGATWIEEEHACNFVLYSQHAERVSLLLFGEDDVARPRVIVDLDPRRQKTWDQWHCRLGEADLRGTRYYAYSVDGPRGGGPGCHRGFDPDKVLLDPYAKELYFPPSFNREAARHPGSNAGMAPLGVLPGHEPAFDCGDDRPPTTSAIRTGRQRLRRVIIAFRPVPWSC